MQDRVPARPADIAEADIVESDSADTGTSMVDPAVPDRPAAGNGGGRRMDGRRTRRKPRLQAAAMALVGAVALVLATLTGVVGAAFLGIVGIAEEARNTTVPRIGAQHRNAMTAAQLSRLAEVILNSRDRARRAAALEEAEALASQFALVVDVSVLDKLDRAVNAVRRSNHRADLIDALTASIRETLAGVDDALALGTSLLAEPDRAVQDYTFLSNLYHLRRLYGEAVATETADALALVDHDILALLRNERALLGSLSAPVRGPSAEHDDGDAIPVQRPVAPSDVRGRLASVLDRFMAARTLTDLHRGRLTVQAQVRQDSDLAYRQLKQLADSLTSDAAATTLGMTERIVEDGRRGLWTSVAGIAATVLLLGGVTVLLRRHVVKPVLRVSRALAVLQEDPQPVALPPASLEEFDRIGHAVERFADALVALHTQTAALRASEGRLNTILQSSPFPIVIARRTDGRILFANAPTVDLLELPAADALGRAVPEFLEDTIDWLAFAQDVFRRGRLTDFETRLKTADGRPFWGVLSAMAMDYEGEAAMFLALHDISARKYAENALVAAKEQAERALHDLQRTQKSLVQAEKLASLGALVAGVAHEINTPVGIGVTAASYLGELTRQFKRGAVDGGLRRRDLDEFIDRIEEAGAMILANLERACTLVQSFKQVAVDQTSEARRPFDLRSYMNGVLGSLAPQLKRTPHRVTLDCPDGITMDSYPGALSQVVSNLVINALVHAFKPEGAGTIAITVRRDGLASVVLDFADDGEGIPPENLERIFEPFFTTRRTEGGSGLGLHIVYNIVVGTLGGRISVDSQPGRGCRFTIALPLTAAPIAQPAVAAGRVEAQQPQPETVG
ncbi:sensor histidine kinase [Azospirillum sp. sgz302134]